MSLKGRIAKYAGAKVVEKVTAITTVEKAVNNLINAVDKYSDENKRDLSGVEPNNELTIKIRSIPLSEVASSVIFDKLTQNRDCLMEYQVYDMNQSLKFFTNAKNTITNREIISLLNANNVKIGSIKESLFSVGIPLIESNVKTCTIMIGDEKLCDLRKSKSFGDYCFEVFEEDYGIKYNGEKHFKITYNDKLHSLAN